MKKQATVIDANPPKEADTRQLIQQFVNERQIQIASPAVEELILRTGNNLAQVINELEKLTVYAADSKHIDLEAVQKLVPKSLTQNVFDLIKVLMKGMCDSRLRTIPSCCLTKSNHCELTPP